MISEAEWEAELLDSLADQEWRPGRGTDIDAMRSASDDLVLRDEFLAALRRLNADVPEEYLRQAMATMLQPVSQDPLAENARFHDLLVHGFRGVTYRDAHGQEQSPTLHLLDERVTDNTWRAVQQVRVVNRQHNRRFDVVLYVNGLPLVIIELKQAGSKNATISKAHSQLATYLHEFPMAFRTVVSTVISDGLEARYGTPFTPLNHYSPWNVDDEGQPVATGAASHEGVLELDLLAAGLLSPERFLDIVRHFTAFDADDSGLTKRIAKPHQYFAVRKAVEATVTAVDSDGRAGVVWHTQGSGKSMEMELYANLVMSHPALLNPTIVVITDRTELDGQLYETFNRSQLLTDSPVQVRTRKQLREQLSSRVTGGIYFTTLQKFGRTGDERDAGREHPLLTDRRNVIVMVDEAHRSHYDGLDGYARHLRDALPHATLIAFTGTPIDEADRNTREVFGGYIDIYDLTRAVEDGATVPVLFEPRLIKVQFRPGMSAEDIDQAADTYTDGLDDAERRRIEASAAVINEIYGAPDRLRELAQDIVTHWEARRQQMDEYLRPSEPGDTHTPHGKALIVGASRDICARLYDEIVKLRPEWHSDELNRGVIKVVYSGDPSDAPIIHRHVRRESENKTIKARLKDVDDELELVIVKDMMLTGFDAPPLHTLYLDRPLKGALLMQTLARVNRTFRGKQDGLLVAYAPLADNLRAALEQYTKSDQENQPVGRDIDEAAATGLAFVDALRRLLADHPWREQLVATDPKGRRRAVSSTVEYLRSPLTPGNQVAEGEMTLGDRFRQLAGQLNRIWAYASGSQTLADVRLDIAFFEEVRVWMAKFDAQEREARGEPIPDEILRMLRSVVAEATATSGITDIYDAAGIPRPSIQTLNATTLQQFQKATNPHLAIEALRDLLVQESQRATGNNVTRNKAFSERINDLMLRYTNSQLTAAEVIAELATLAREVAAESDRGNQFTPPLTHDELAFYDAVSQNESALLEQGDEVLAQIARELVGIMQRDTHTDWTNRTDVQAKLRSEVKRLLRKHHYPPDRQPEAVKLVIEQMEVLAPEYAERREEA